MSNTLDKISPGSQCVVSGFTESSPITQRLMQLGVLEGSQLEMIRQAPGGDPLEIRVMGYSLSLRKQEAQTILVD